MQKSIIKYSIFFILSGCSSPNLWNIDSIATGNKSFDTSRLRYVSPQAHPSFAFEMIHFGSGIEAFINLNHLHFTSDREITVLCKAGKENFEAIVPVYEGGMRIRLPLEMTARLIQALQDEEEVVILVDGFEETLDPNQFSPLFAQFSKEL